MVGYASCLSPTREQLSLAPPPKAIKWWHDRGRSRIDDRRDACPTIFGAKESGPGRCAARPTGSLDRAKIVRRRVSCHRLSAAQQLARRRASAVALLKDRLPVD